MGIDWVTFIAQIINLFVLVWLLKKFLYHPILNAVEKRQAEIHNKIQSAVEKEQQAEQMRAELTRQMAQFEQDKQSQFDTAMSELAEYRAEQMQNTKDQAVIERKKAQEKLNQEVMRTSTTIRQITADNFVQFATKIVQDLSGVDTLDRSLDLFCQKLSTLKKTETNKINKSYIKENVIKITSSNELSKKQCEKLAICLSKTFNWELPLKMDFETNTDLILGIEMNIGNTCVEWNLKSYLEDYQHNLNTALSTLIAKE